MCTANSRKKEAIREKIRSLRRGFELDWMEQASHLITEKVMALPQYETAQVVGCFLSLRYEVRTETLIKMCWKLGKRVCVPAMEKISHDYVLAWLEAGEEIVRGPANIPQTKNIRPVQPSEVNLMIVPAMAFDRSGNRLGHGNGHFDRLLSQCSGYKIGLVFEAQIVNDVPVEAQDVSVDIVVTEQTLYPSANIRGR